MIVKQTVATETIDMLMERLHSNRAQINAGKKGFKKVVVIDDEVHLETVTLPEEIKSKDTFTGIRSL